MELFFSFQPVRLDGNVTKDADFAKELFHFRQNGLALSDFFADVSSFLADSLPEISFLSEELSEEELRLLPLTDSLLSALGIPEPLPDLRIGQASSHAIDALRNPPDFPLSPADILLLFRRKMADSLDSLETLLGKTFDPVVRSVLREMLSRKHSQAELLDGFCI